MLRRDKIIAAIIVAQFVVVGAVVAVRNDAQQNPPAQRLRGVPVSLVIGTKGGLRSAGPRNAAASAAAFTLVEFGDYQCPPCAASAPDVLRLLRNHPGKLAFQFRHYPLKKIHPLAERAALLAEAARPRGTFWRIHDALYRKGAAGLSVQALAGLETPGEAAKTAARETVGKDVADARRIGVDRTPTFLLCGPGDQVVRLGSLEQAESYLR